MLSVLVLDVLDDLLNLFLVILGTGSEAQFAVTEDFGDVETQIDPGFGYYSLVFDEFDGVWETSVASAVSW